MGVDKISAPERKTDALRERVIKKFIEEKAYSPKDVLELADKFADLAAITAAGEVSLKCKCRTDIDKIAIISIARFLGELLKEETKIDVKAEVTAEEVARYAMLDKSVAAARLNDLVKDGLLTRVSRGVFRVKYISRAEKWVDHLHQKYIKKQEK